MKVKKQETGKDTKQGRDQTKHQPCRTSSSARESEALNEPMPKRSHRRRHQEWTRQTSKHSNDYNNDNNNNDDDDDEKQQANLRSSARRWFAELSDLLN